jgi:hypothetical protein
MALKTFMVADADGNKVIEAEQLATFAYYIQQIQFRFVVTRFGRDNTVALTDRASGKRVAAIPFTAIQASLGDYAVAGKGELKKLIDRAGEARVRSVLNAA